MREGERRRGRKGVRGGWEGGRRVRPVVSTSVLDSGRRV